MGREMNILEIFQAVKKRISILFILVIGFGILGTGTSFLLNKKNYVSTTTLTVGSESERNTDEINELTGEPVQEKYIKYGNNSISKESIKFYREILKSEELLEKVINETNLNLSNKELRDSIFIENPEDSGTLLLSIRNPKIKNVEEIVNKTTSFFIEKNLEITELDNIRIINEASDVKLENTIDILRNTIILMVLGASLGVVIIIILQYLDNRIVSKKEINEKLKLPVLGTINSKKSKEDLKKIRTIIENAPNLKEKNKIVVAPLTPNISNVTLKLAEVFVEKNYEVLLIDTNFRKPEVHQELSLQNDLGISDLLTKNSTLEETVKKHKGLNILTSGSKLDSPSELLSGTDMADFLNEIENKYDYIFFNGHSLTDVSDTSSLSILTDGVILVGEIEKTDINTLEEVKEYLESLDIDILGVVLQ